MVVSDQREVLHPLKSSTQFLCPSWTHVFFRDYHVISYSGPWCNPTTGEGVNRLIKVFGSFDTVLCESKPLTDITTNFGPQSKRVYRTVSCESSQLKLPHS